MQRLEAFKQFTEQIVRHGAVHIFALGFEERCLAYPQQLSAANPPLALHKYFCIDLGDVNVSGFLKTKRESHRQQIRALIPSTHFIIEPKDIGDEVAGAYPDASICVDLSCMPRSLLFTFVRSLIYQRKGRRLFFIYSYPKAYVDGVLQDPGADVRQIEIGTNGTGDPLLIIVPGFDVEYCNLVMHHARMKYQRSVETMWLFPLGAERYSLYERALCANLLLVHDSRVRLLAQDYIGVAARQFASVIRGAYGRPVMIAPLGPRITCASLLVALASPDQEKRNLTVIFPLTRLYNSVRSVSFGEPLIEECPDI